MAEVSVIIPVFNVETYIKRAIHSVLSQIDVDVQLIVVDDASTDETWSVIQSIMDVRMTTFQNEVNKGPAYCRNKGIELAQGEWLAILDGDDFWSNERLRKMVDFCKEEHLDGCFDDIWIQAQRPNAIRYSELVPKNRRLFALSTISLLDVVNTYVAFFKPIISMTFLNESKVRYRENMRYSEDFCFVYDMVAAGARLAVLNMALYFYTSSRPGSLSSDADKLFQGIVDSAALYITTEKNTVIIHGLEQRISEAYGLWDYHRTIIDIQGRHYLRAVYRTLRRPQVLFHGIMSVLNRIYRKLKDFHII